MASTNQSPQYKKVESEYLQAQTDEDRIYWLQEMIKECPKHKSSEKMLAQLKTRLKKLKEKIEKAKKSKKSGKPGIKKHDMQVALIGLANSGKSSILNQLTNANSKVSEIRFTTKYPIQGIMDYEGVQIQIIDLPGIESEYFDSGIANTADILLIIVDKLGDIEKVMQKISLTHGKKIISFNKSDKLNENEKRKISETLKSRKLNFIIISSETKEGLSELKERIFKSFDIARIYLKEPGKNPSNKPLIVRPNTPILGVANKISHELAKTIKEVRIWGPSSKFPNQKVGLNHLVKDKDIVEFKTR